MVFSFLNWLDIEDDVCLLQISFIELVHLSVSLLNKGFDPKNYDKYSRNLYVTIMSFYSNMVVLLTISATLAVDNLTFLFSFL